MVLVGVRKVLEPGGPLVSSGAGMMRLRSANCACAWEIGMVVVFLGPMVPALKMGIGAEICKI